MGSEPGDVRGDVIPGRGGLWRDLHLHLKGGLALPLKGDLVLHLKGALALPQKGARTLPQKDDSEY